MENFDLKSSLKTYEVDWEKITTVEDIITVMKPMNMVIKKKEGDILPDIVQALFDKGFLKEVSEIKFFKRDKE